MDPKQTILDYFDGEFNLPDEVERSRIGAISEAVRKKVRTSFDRLKPEKVDASKPFASFLYEQGVSTKGLQLCQRLTELIGTPDRLVWFFLYTLKDAPFPETMVIDDSIVRDPYSGLVRAVVSPLNITIGEVKHLIAKLEEWIEARKMQYVGEAWNYFQEHSSASEVVDRMDRDTFKHRRFRPEDRARYSQQILAEAMQVSINEWYLANKNRSDVRDYYLIENATTLRHDASRSGKAEQTHTIQSTITTGLGSAIAFSGGTLAVIASLCPDMKSAEIVDVYRRSKRACLARLASMNINFIGLFQSFLQNPSFQEDILRLAKDGLLAPQEVDRLFKAQAQGSGPETSQGGGRMRSAEFRESTDRKKFDKNCYHVKDDGSVAPKEEVVQFILYLAACLSDIPKAKFKHTGCPMANLKRQPQGVPYVQEFSEMSAEVYELACERFGVE